MKLILHIKAWYKWIHYVDYDYWTKLAVLFRLSYIPSFGVIRARTEIDYSLDNIMTNKKYLRRKLIQKILMIISVVSLIILSLVYLNIKDVHAIKLIETSLLNKDIEIKPKLKLYSIGEIYNEDDIETEEVIKIEKELTIEERIKNACNDYGVPFNIALAIARLETGWFKSDAYLYKNNPGGLSKNEVPKAFNTIEEGVDAFISNLSKNYIAIGLDDPDSIGNKYCPVDPTWSSKVKSLMKRGE